MEASPSLATESSEQANRTAPLKSPSSSFSDTLDVRICRGSWKALCPWPGCRERSGWWAGRGDGSDSSASCWLMHLVKFQRRPPLLGVRRQRVGQRRRRSQEWALLTVVTSSKMDANFLAAGSREARRSLFKTLTQGSGEKLATGGGSRARDAEGMRSTDPGSWSSRVSGAIVLGEPPEPPQRRQTGPCTRIVPLLRRGICRRQTAQGARVMLCSATGDSLVLMLILVLVLCVFILCPQSRPPESQKPAIKRMIVRTNHSAD